MRIQVELTPQRVDQLKTLMAELGIENYKDLFNNALTVLEWAADQKRKGREVASLNEDEKNYRVLALPALESIKSSLRVNGALAKTALNGVSKKISSE